MKGSSDANGIHCLSISVISDDFLDLKTKEMVLTTANETKSKEGGPECAINSQQYLVTDDVPPKMITQVFGAFVVALTHFGTGTIYGFPAITLPQLTQPDGEDIYLTPDNAALFGSIVNIGGAFGGLMSGPLIVRIGLRKSMLLFLPVALAFWLMVAFSSNALLLILSRLGLGAVNAIISPLAYTYVMEISHKDRRGILFAAIPTSRQIGFLFVFSLGSSVLSWRQIALVCGTVTTIPPFIGLLFFPESPRWLVTRGREEEAKMSLIFFRGQKYDSQSELNAVIKEVKRTGEKKNICQQFGQLFQKAFLKSLLVISFLTFATGFNGSLAITTNLVPIFEISSSSVDSYTSAILVGAVRVLGTLFHLVLIDRFGRRPLHLSSYFVMSFTLVVLGGYFYMFKIDWVTNNLGWLPLTSVMIYTFFGGLGLPVVNLMQGELLPNNVRAIGMCFLGSIARLAGFVATQLYFVMTGALGEHGTFWTYGITCMGITVFSYFTIPETNGLSLEEISDDKVNGAIIDQGTASQKKSKMEIQSQNVE